MLLPTLSLLLGYRPSVSLPTVTTFGMYSSTTHPSPGTHSGTLVIVRHVLLDGQAPVIGRSHWERVLQDDGTKKAVLKGEMDNFQSGHHAATLPDDAFYSLGTVEALSYNPEIAAWRVPSIGGVRRVFTAENKACAFTQYRLQPGVEGIYWFANRVMRLRVCPNTFDGAPDLMIVNHQPVSTNVRALAHFDTSGRLVGFGSQWFQSEDIESVEAGSSNGGTAPLVGITGSRWPTFLGGRLSETQTIDEFGWGPYPVPTSASPAEQSALLAEIPAPEPKISEVHLRSEKED